MKAISSSIKVLDPVDGEKILKKLEMCGRTCYQSEPKTDPSKFIGAIVRRGHTSVLEHVQLTFDLVTDRGVLAEITRHRIGCSYSVESTRYCKYNDEKMEFIIPIEFTDGSEESKKKLGLWQDACIESEHVYNQMMTNNFCTAEQARSVLNNSLKVNMKFSANIRALRNFFMLRCDKAAHPHIKEIAIPMLLSLKERIPVVFDDIKYDEEFYNKYKEALPVVEYVGEE